MRDNPQEWQAGLYFELELLIALRTFKILKGLLLLGVNLQSCKIVLRNKIHTNNTIA